MNHRKLTALALAAAVGIGMLGTPAAASASILDGKVNYGSNSMFSKILRDHDSRGTIIRVYAKPVNLSHVSNATIWAKYKDIVPTAYETTSMYNQLICHVRNVGLVKQPWNLEPWRKNVGYTRTVAEICNPKERA